MPVSDGASTVRRFGRPGAASLTDARWWGYRWRCFPIATFLAFGVVGVAFAVASDLDAPIEATVLAIIGSMAISIVFLDPAAPITESSVVPLAWRRCVPSLLGLGAATASWLIARSLAVAIGPAPWPGRWALLEWLTIACSQLAVGAAANRRRAETTSFGPGLVVALIWYVSVAAPRLHSQLFDTVDHPWRWIALLAGSAAVSAAASLDPARRNLRGVHQ
jgi:hypothetical protein